MAQENKGKKKELENVIDDYERQIQQAEKNKGMYYADLRLMNEAVKLLKLLLREPRAYIKTDVKKVVDQMEEKKGTIIQGHSKCQELLGFM